MMLGWKAITGTILLAASTVVGNLWPELSQLIMILQFFGTLLGGIGIRQAIAKNGQGK